MFRYLLVLLCVLAMLAVVSSSRLKRDGYIDGVIVRIVDRQGGSTFELQYVLDDTGLPPVLKKGTYRWYVTLSDSKDSPTWSAEDDRAGFLLKKQVLPWSGMASPSGGTFADGQVLDDVYYTFERDLVGEESLTPGSHTLTPELDNYKTKGQLLLSANEWPVPGKTGFYIDWSYPRPKSSATCACTSKNTNDTPFSSASIAAGTKATKVSGGTGFPTSEETWDYTLRYVP